MRTTIDLPEDLHRIAASLARDTARSLSQTVEYLMRRGLETNQVTQTKAAYHVSPATGLPVVRSERPITSADVKALEDDI